MLKRIKEWFFSYFILIERSDVQYIIMKKTWINMTSDMRQNYVYIGYPNSFNQFVNIFRRKEWKKH